MRMKLALLVIFLSPLLMGAKSGCLGFGAEPELTVVDTYCLNAKKRDWSIEDSSKTIQEAMVHNGTIDRKCGLKRTTS